jgi:hypothetical protein
MIITRPQNCEPGRLLKRLATPNTTSAKGQKWRVMERMSAQPRLLASRVRPKVAMSAPMITE